MTDEERQRTMDFILQQQAQFAVNMQKLEEQQAQSAANQQRTDGRLKRVERVVVRMTRQFRQERKDLRERMAALVNAQMMADERHSHLDEKMNALIDAQIRTEASLRSLATVTERNGRDIAALAKANNTDSKTEGEDDGGGTPA